MPVSTDAWVDLVKTLFIPGGIATVVIAAVVGWRRGPTGKSVEGTVVSAALADGVAVRDLVEELRRNRLATCETADQRHRDSEQERDVADELAREIRHWRDEMRRQAATPPDWALSLLAKMDGRKA